MWLKLICTGDFKRTPLVQFQIIDFQYFEKFPLYNLSRQGKNGIPVWNSPGNKGMKPELLTNVSQLYNQYVPRQSVTPLQKSLLLLQL